jgi:hypothetical protein
MSRPTRLRDDALGVVVPRASAVLVTNATTSLFTITGGLVAITALFGQVTVAIPNTASLTAKLVFTPSGGSVADLTAATGITDDALGTLYGWSYPDGDELMSQLTEGGTEAPSVNFAPLLNPRAILPSGAIAVTVSNHTSSPGAVKWYCAYVPIDNGARVAAA